MLIYCVNVTAAYSIAMHSLPAMNFQFRKSMQNSSGYNSVADPNLLYTKSQCYIISNVEKCIYYIVLILLASLNCNNRNTSGLKFM
jgi:hypothetical protein